MNPRLARRKAAIGIPDRRQLTEKLRFGFFATNGRRVVCEIAHLPYALATAVDCSWQRIPRRAVDGQSETLSVQLCIWKMMAGDVHFAPC
jgi:hypothetical protein